MEICSTIAEMRALAARYRDEGERLALVPTMGALHAGHMELVRRARACGDRVVVWIFVNPTQFDRAADLAAYPRDLEGDLEKLRAQAVDAVFTPEAHEIYPDGAETIVECTHLGNVLHGAVRPGHFRGVTTVVTKFFNIIQPDVAIFGEKDYQQLQIIRRMVRDLMMPIEIVAVPTVREEDGLAMSSRNVRLTPEDRTAATVLCRALDAAEAAARPGNSVSELEALIRQTIAAEPRANLRGLDIAEARTLAPVAGPLDRPVAIMLSAEFGGILLIDQREITP